MRGVADAKQTRFVPAGETVDADREQFHIIERGDLCTAIGEEWRLPYDLGAKRVKTAAMDLFYGALRNDIGALPIITAIDLHENAAGVEAAARLFGISRFTRHVKPQQVE